MSKPGQFRADLPELARLLLKDGPQRTRPTARRVRVILKQTFIVDTTKAMHVWEHIAYPQYYVPTTALKNCKMKDKETINAADDASSPAAAVVELTIPAHDGVGEFTTDRALRFSDDEKLSGLLKGMIRLEFGSMDQWLEEEVPIYVHPKDPFKRIDILPSKRSVEVQVAGDAQYYHVVIDGEEHKNLVWYYRTTTHESAGIAGLLSFYNEKVDIIIDGELLERPKTFFS
ncbi:hypothetical protein K4K60_000543 [Colletotrichum sp. SAR11_57]|nr:hypothetical protein K4K60_000543 [Colletotrichum sp. SAR11_57]